MKDKGCRRLAMKRSAWGSSTSCHQRFDGSCLGNTTFINDRRKTKDACRRFGLSGMSGSS